MQAPAADSSLRRSAASWLLANSDHPRLLPGAISVDSVYFTPRAARARGECGAWSPRTV